MGPFSINLYLKINSKINFVICNYRYLKLNYYVSFKKIFIWITMYKNWYNFYKFDYDLLMIVSDIAALSLLINFNIIIIIAILDFYNNY